MTAASDTNSSKWRQRQSRDLILFHISCVRLFTLMRNPRVKFNDRVYPSYSIIDTQKSDIKSQTWRKRIRRHSWALEKYVSLSKLLIPFGIIFNCWDNGEDNQKQARVDGGIRSLTMRIVNSSGGKVVLVHANIFVLDAEGETMMIYRQ